MGNSNIQESTIKQQELQLYRHSTFYGRYQIKDNHAVKKYEVPQSQNEDFVGLIQSYRKIDHPSLISIENVLFISEEHQTYRYQLYFPFYTQTLQDQIKLRKRSYTQKQLARLIIDVGEAIKIFSEKQFPYGLISPNKVAVKELNQGYCVGIDILMNPHQASHHQSNQNKLDYYYLSPQQKNIQQLGGGFDHNKSALFSLGLIALKCASYRMESGFEEMLFQLRKDYSFQFCSLLESMLKRENFERISLDECLLIARQIFQTAEDGEISKHQFIRGYNCIQSMCLFDDLHESILNNKWNQKYQRK